MSFWLLAAAGLAAAVFWLLRPLMRRTEGSVQRASFDMQVYRDQLAEVEADLARGVLSESEAEGSRAEVSRRLLAAASEADRGTGGGPAPRSASRWLAAGIATVTAAASLGLYFHLGAPGYHDRPLALRIAELRAAQENRPSQAEAEANMPARQPVAEPDKQAAALIEQLEETLKNRPDDIRGHELLADNLGRLGRFADARAAQQKVVELKGDAATAEDHAQHAEFMIWAAGGYVSPEAEQALTDALKADPKNVAARYYSGIALAQANRPDLTMRIWRELLAEGPEDAPWIAMIRAQIGELAAQTGIPAPEAAAPPPGPSAEDVEAARNMDEQDRDAMIRGMVGRLADRLTAEGGPSEDWARLIRAYGVLGETEKAASAWSDAQKAFAGDETALAALRQAARDAGAAD
ncbi:MAG: c-type cytochrome biogenesis protein CcmI [Paracoccaceae bacterium]